MRYPPSYNLCLTQKTYKASVVQDIATVAHNSGWQARDKLANEDLAALRTAHDRERLRLQVAHSLITAMQTIIDP